MATKLSKQLKREIEVDGELLRNMPTRGDEMRDGFLELSFTSKRDTLLHLRVAAHCLVAVGLVAAALREAKRRGKQESECRNTGDEECHECLAQEDWPLGQHIAQASTHAVARRGCRAQKMS